jgi:hypothetical protein
MEWVSEQEMFLFEEQRLPSGPKQRFLRKGYCDHSQDKGYCDHSQDNRYCDHSQDKGYCDHSQDKGYCDHSQDKAKEFWSWNSPPYWKVKNELQFHSHPSSNFIVCTKTILKSHFSAEVISPTIEQKKGDFGYTRWGSTAFTRQCG